jgi:Rieske Fe-S protein
MAEPGTPVSSRRTLLACAGAACAAVLAGCARGGAGNAGMAASQPAQGASTATVPADWGSGAVAALGASPAQARRQPPAQAQGQSPTSPASAQSQSPMPEQSQSSAAAQDQPPALAATSAVPVGGGMILSAKKIVITQPQAGSFKAFTAVCTHMGCTVSTVSDGTINCPCHGSKFSVANGSVVAGPAPSPLAPVSIKVQGTSIVPA